MGHRTARHITHCCTTTPQHRTHAPHTPYTLLHDRTTTHHHRTDQHRSAVHHRHHHQRHDNRDQPIVSIGGVDISSMINSYNQSKHNICSILVLSLSWGGDLMHITIGLRLAPTSLIIALSYVI